MVNVPVYCGKPINKTMKILGWERRAKLKTTELSIYHNSVSVYYSPESLNGRKDLIPIYNANSSEHSKY
jgi:hypothetical protein